MGTSSVSTTDQPKLDEGVDPKINPASLTSASVYAGEGWVWGAPLPFSPSRMILTSRQSLNC